MSAEPRPLSAATTLGRRLRDDVRRRILAREWAPGDRLPSESELALSYEVSRVTVRTALKNLEQQGLVDIRHGSGTFVAGSGAEIRAGLQELRSITETIREMGYTPGMDWHKTETRAPSKLEASRLSLASDVKVFAFERAILADGKAVAFSYDAVPMTGRLADVPQHVGEGSLFAALDAVGVDPVRATAELHAVNDPSIGWGRDRPRTSLYLLLDQVHFDRSSQAVVFGRTYFVEGRFQFMIHRTR